MAEIVLDVNKKKKTTKHKPINRLIIFCFFELGKHEHEMFTVINLKVINLFWYILKFMRSKIKYFGEGKIVFDYTLIDFW